MNGAADKVAFGAHAACVGSGFAMIPISEINQWLQAGVFVVGMVSGICAAIYYIRKSRADK